VDPRAHGCESAIGANNSRLGGELGGQDVDCTSYLAASIFIYLLLSTFSISIFIFFSF
jgi:hypothetical protein